MTRVRWAVLVLLALPIAGCAGASGGAGRPGLVGCYTDGAPTAREDTVRPLVFLFCVQSP
jgi:hypothetical protein